MCMVDDGEGWKVFRSEWRTARKQHACYDCGRKIEPGERYYFATGISNDDWRRWDTYRECAHCQYAAKWLLAECGGYLFGGILEDLEEHWDGELMRDLHIGRAIVGLRRRWRRKDGSLMAVPT